MTPGHDLIIVGASARAAAFSALRAGLRPWCLDLFADADLRACCPAATIPPEDYPAGFADRWADTPPLPWLFTGALENHPKLLRKLAAARPLWGSSVSAVQKVREPLRVTEVLRGRGVPCPTVLDPGPPTLPGGRWLIKPVRSAGGKHVRPWRPEPGVASPPGHHYFQEYIEGVPCAAVFTGDRNRATLLGATRQLIGERWLQAGGFQYCGSVGPLTLPPEVTGRFTAVGRALAEGFNLRGVFGVDCVLRDGTPYAVEVNPRYTASVEVLEHSTGVPALALHRRVFDPAAPAPLTQLPAADVLGKAILFAHSAFAFPADGPWRADVRAGRDPWELPRYADIPVPGTPLEAGHPVLTVFARGPTDAACEENLRAAAREVYECLPGATG